MKTKSLKQIVKDHGYLTWPCGGRKYALFELVTRKSHGAFKSQSEAFAAALKLPKICEINTDAPTVMATGAPCVGPMGSGMLHYCPKCRFGVFSCEHDAVAV